MLGIIANFHHSLSGCQSQPHSVYEAAKDDCILCPWPLRSGMAEAHSVPTIAHSLFLLCSLQHQSDPFPCRVQTHLSILKAVPLKNLYGAICDSMDGTGDDYAE